MPTKPKSRQRRQPSVREPPLVVVPNETGFLVYRATTPDVHFCVSGAPQDPNCPCREFVWCPEPEHRCEHVQAVFKYLHRLGLVPPTTYPVPPLIW